jgi:hypothetical protein
MKLAPAVVLELADDRGFLYHGGGGEAFLLNGAAVIVLQALLDGRGKDAAIDELVRRYDVSKPRARNDVQKFIGHLRSIRALIDHE